MKGRSTIIYSVSVRALRDAAFFCAAAWLLMPAVSCERRPLADQSYNVYLDLEIEDEITNYEQYNKSISADGYSSQVQLKITVNIRFTNNKNHQWSTTSVRKVLS